MKIIEGEKFKKEFKKLRKKCSSLEADFCLLKKIILDDPIKQNKHAHILKKSDSHYLLKIRMMCRVVKGSSFRIIYYYDGKNIELIFIEIYFKGNKGTEDKKRIESFWKKLSN